ncbi:GntR family transcriptional regulator [Streptomyces yaizuensis]|uniref:GntR family transcriptional regulator n=1 Tax=Streptomyces yaizuensis TaxID=2989713 RepID=A0ABQ5NZZ6_9ACTN|nr:GntR family transcriptional regulator [Streptomyces sp. YSPA8]GLF95936.1 GntR family transcriptional regulator [Streptomyces sp. YSPA8]
MPRPGPNGARTAVTRNTLRQQIADALRDEVLAGRLLPGQEFTVRQIAEQYGVSATPVREALVDLSAQGLLDCDQHRGFKVHRFTVADYRTMVESRSLVMDGVIRHAERRGRARTHAVAMVAVRRRAEEAARAARCGDLDIHIGYDLRYWHELGTILANPYISGFLHRLRVQGWVFAVPHLRVDDDRSGWLWSGHEELVDAVTLGDLGAARAVIDAHNDRALAWADRLERPDRTDGPDPADRPDLPDRPDRPERPDLPDRRERRER